MNITNLEKVSAERIKLNRLFAYVFGLKLNSPTIDRSIKILLENYIKNKSYNLTYYPLTLTR